MLNCSRCGDQLKIGKGGWPFWMHLALRDGFAAIHKDCEAVQSAKSRSIYESVFYERQ